VQQISILPVLQRIRVGQLGDDQLGRCSRSDRVPPRRKPRSGGAGMLLALGDPRAVGEVLQLTAGRFGVRRAANRPTW